MSTLREKIAVEIWKAQIREQDNSEAVTAILVAVIEHATCEEAVKRFLLEQYGEPDEDDPSHNWAPDTFQIISDSIRAAIEG